MFYEDVIRSLQEHEVKYLIVGGAAMILHGVPRMTGDLDIMIDLAAENVAAAVKAMEAIELHPAVPVDAEGLAVPHIRNQWMKEKNLRALTFQSQRTDSPYREVDIVLDSPVPFEEMYQNRIQLKADDLTLSLISIEHLKEIKKKSGRQQDKADIESLEKLSREMEE